MTKASSGLLIGGSETDEKGVYCHLLYNGVESVPGPGTYKLNVSARDWGGWTRQLCLSTVQSNCA